MYQMEPRLPWLIQEETRENETNTNDDQSQQNWLGKNSLYAIQLSPSYCVPASNPTLVAASLPVTPSGHQSILIRSDLLNRIPIKFSLSSPKKIELGYIDAGGSEIETLSLFWSKESESLDIFATGQQERFGWIKFGKDGQDTSIGLENVPTPIFYMKKLEKGEAGFSLQSSSGVNVAVGQVTKWTPKRYIKAWTEIQFHMCPKSEGWTPVERNMAFAVFSFWVVNKINRRQKKHCIRFLVVWTFIAFVLIIGFSRQFGFIQLRSHDYGKDRN